MTQKFRNILEDFKKNSNDFLWISRAINFIEAYNRNHPSVSPGQLKTIVAGSTDLHEMLTVVSGNKLSSLTKKEVLDILEEIGYAYDLAIIRWLGLFLVKMLRKSLSGLYINERKLSMIVSEMGASPVLFVPTHRSYGDFILMAFVCFKFNVQIPCVAAGMDFLSMRLMNKALRKSKAFFMRRKFADDAVYRSVFQEYIRAMISFEKSPIEFFIEGTRSRTGKSLPPKFGFLAMVIEAYLSGNIPDLMIVPINISYDRVLEETLFAYELLGIPKPKESTKGFFKALKVLGGNYGNVHINFGDPFSIRSFFDDEFDFRYRCPEKESNKIRHIAYKIIKMQQSLQIYSCFNILALVLYDYIIRTHSYTIKLQDALKNADEILYLFGQYGANVYIEGDLETSIIQSINVHNSIVNLSSDNLLVLKKPVVKFQDNANKNITGCNLDEGIVEEGVSLIMLQLYVNPSLILFIRSSIIVTVLKCLTKGNELINIDLLYQNYQYVCEIFKHEFVINSSDFKEYNDSIFKLVAVGVIELHEETVKLNNFNNAFCVFLNFKPFIISANEFCNFLLEEDITEKNQLEIIKNVQYYISVKFMSGIIEDYYCLSLDLLSNISNSLIDIKVLFRDKRKNKLFINKELLSDISNYLSCLINGRMLPQQMNTSSYIFHNSLQSKL